MVDDLLHYDKLVENALKGVVRTALLLVQKNGLPGSHHFYITFRIDHPDAVVPPYLREKYPDEMTIVLQYQFEDLIVRDDLFSVALSFNNVLEHLTVPFAAVTGFADPSVKFGLQFHVDDIESEIAEHPSSGDAALRSRASDGDEAAPTGEEGEKVVSLDSFRKKK